MSLKAKLEAVIYAAEEPVTLAQLSVLFAGEALAWKAEQAPELPMADVAGDETEDSSAELLDVVLEAEARATTPEEKAEAEALIAELTGPAAPVEAAKVEPDSSPASEG